MKRFRNILMILLLAIGSIGLVGCEKNTGEGPAEQAGKALDNAVDKADEKLKEVAEDTKEVVKDTAEDVKEEVEKAVDN